MHFSSIYLMMGEKCNFSCRYCIQHDVFHTPCPVQVNPGLVDYLNNLEVKPYRTNKGNQPKTKTLVQFYGGEPLLYFATIKYFVERLDKRKFDFSIISNSELLTQEMVDYFNEYDICFTLSNDGPKTNELRNKNMLEDESFLRLFLQLEQKSISAVVTAVNYQVDEIWQYFQKVFKDKEVMINYDYIMDTGGLEAALRNFDQVKFDNYMAELFADLSNKAAADSLNFYEGCYVASFAKRLLYTTSPNYQSGTTKCGVVTKSLNIDMEGNIYLCHNSSTRLGNVFTSEYGTVIETFEKNYNIYAKSAKCMECPANVLCAGGCILVGDEARKAYYCDIHKIIHKYFTNLLLNFSDQLQL